MTSLRSSGVVSLFDTEFVLKEVFPKELSRDLHKAFELRQLTDYKTSKPISPEKTKEALDNAARFVAAVKKYLL
jgi:uncharacterized protein (UPF0332 family)